MNGRCWRIRSIRSRFLGFLGGWIGWGICPILGSIGWTGRCSTLGSIGTWGRCCPGLRLRRIGRLLIGLLACIIDVLSRCFSMLLKRFIAFILSISIFILMPSELRWLIRLEGCFYHLIALAIFFVKFQKVTFDWQLLPRSIFTSHLLNQVFPSSLRYPIIDH